MIPSSSQRLAFARRCVIPCRCEPWFGPYAALGFVVLADRLLLRPCYSNGSRYGAQPAVCCWSTGSSKSGCGCARHPALRARPASPLIPGSRAKSENAHATSRERFEVFGDGDRAHSAGAFKGRSVAGRASASPSMRTRLISGSTGAISPSRRLYFSASARPRSSPIHGHRQRLPPAARVSAQNARIVPR